MIRLQNLHSLTPNKVGGRCTTGPEGLLAVKVEAAMMALAMGVKSIAIVSARPEGIFLSAAQGAGEIGTQIINYYIEITSKGMIALVQSTHRVIVETKAPKRGFD